MSLPTKEQYEQLKERRRQENELKLQRERQVRDQMAGSPNAPSQMKDSLLYLKINFGNFSLPTYGGICRFLLNRSTFKPPKAGLSR